MLRFLQISSFFVVLNALITADITASLIRIDKIIMTSLSKCSSLQSFILKDHEQDSQNEWLFFSKKVKEN